MKAKKLLPALFTLLLFSTFSIAQNNTIELLLIVDTDKITQDNINETCKFEGQPDDIDITDYTTEVQIGDEVNWKVKNIEGNSKGVKLVKFKHETGKKFFKEDSIKVKLGKIKGEIKEGESGEIEKYTLEIEVKKDGRRDWEIYYIDPKLKLTQ